MREERQCSDGQCDGKDMQLVCERVLCLFCVYAALLGMISCEPCVMICYLLIAVKCNERVRT